MNKNIKTAHDLAEWTEKGLGQIILLLHDMQYLPDNPKTLQFSSGGGFEHLVIQNKEGYWLLFGNNEHGVSISKEQFVDANAAYEAFWEDEGKAFGNAYVAVDLPGYSQRRPALNVVRDIINNNWIEN